MLKRNLYLNTLLFADDQIIIQDSEDNPQKSVYILNQTKLEQEKKFNYLGCKLSLHGEPDFDKKNKQIPKNMRHY